jgi:hypothetical protein
MVALFPPLCTNLKIIAIAQTKNPNRKTVGVIFYQGASTIPISLSFVAISGQIAKINFFQKTRFGQYAFLARISVNLPNKKPQPQVYV